MLKDGNKGKTQRIKVEPVDFKDNLVLSKHSESLEPLIELKGVSKSFGSQRILDRVDLTIYRGEALGIIGPSGTGKSTILRIIAGLLPPDEGEVYILGKNGKDGSMILLIRLELPWYFNRRLYLIL